MLGAPSTACRIAVRYRRATAGHRPGERPRSGPRGARAAGGARRRAPAGGERSAAKPLVRIDLIAGQPDERVRAIGDAVHQALTECLGVPPRDRFQIIGEHPPGRLRYDPACLDVARGAELVIVHATLSAGRSTAQKQAYYARLAALLAAGPGLRPQDLTVVLAENTREDWSFGNGEAQYVVLPRERWR
jgi:4-oxalocrotonate tautomerase